MPKKKRASILKGSTVRIKTGCGTLYITINNDEEDKPVEIFVRLGKSGGCASSQCESIGRMLSWGLKSGADIEEAIKTLSGIRCNETNISDEKYSCSDAVSRALSKRYIENPKEEPVISTVVEETIK